MYIRWRLAGASDSNRISESLLISNYTQQIDTYRNALQRKRGLSSAYLLCLSKQTAAYLIEFDVSQTITGNRELMTFETDINGRNCIYRGSDSSRCIL